MNIHDAYIALNELQLARSQVEFSTLWLGRSPRYYSHLLASCRPAGMGTLLALQQRMQRVAACTADPITQSQLRSLAVGLSAHIELRGLVGIRLR